jgi:hypothetical protein
VSRGSRRLSRAARCRKGGDVVDEEARAFRSWQNTLSDADHDLARELIDIGRQRGWLTKGGTIVPPGTDPPTPGEEMNAAIRRAAGR